MCAAREGSRENICVCSAPRGPRVSWHALETIDTALVVPGSKTDRSLDGPLSREASDDYGACVPKLHFVTPPGSLSGLLSHLSMVKLSLYLEDSNSRWAHLTYLITSFLGLCATGKVFCKNNSVWWPPFGISDHSTSDSEETGMRVSEGRMEMRHDGSQVSLNIWMGRPFCRTLWVTDSRGVVGLHSRGPLTEHLPWA